MDQRGSLYCPVGGNPFVIYQLWANIPEIYQRVQWLLKASIPVVLIARRGLATIRPCR